jgi:hypothetical protein
MIIVAVRDTITEEAFYQLPKAIYKNDPKWISPLIQDIKKVFDPTQNKYHDEGEITRWILQEDGTTIGQNCRFCTS